MLGRFSDARSTLAIRLLATSTLLFCGSAARAGSPGGSIDYGPISGANVPALGEWTLALMGLLLAVVAYRALRGRVNGRLLSNLILVGGAVAAAASGHDLIREAQAIVELNDYDMSSPSGGTVTGYSWARLTNSSGMPLRIKAIHPNRGSNIQSPPPDDGAGSPECTVNSVVAPNAKCTVRFVYVD